MNPTTEPTIERRFPQLKVFKLGDQACGIDGFRAALNAFAKSGHRALPRVYKHHEVEGEKELDIYLLLEHFEGDSLEYWVPREEEQLWSIAEELCIILKELHQARPAIEHRNLKPANIIQTSEGLKLINFGLLDSTQSGHFDPKTRYFRHHMKDDVYALGALMVFLATGEDPFQDPKSRRIRWVEDAKVAIAPGLQLWIERCVDANSEARFASAGHAHAALQEGWNEALVEFFDKGLLVLEEGSERLVLRPRPGNFFKSKGVFSTDFWVMVTIGAFLGAAIYLHNLAPVVELIMVAGILYSVVQWIRGIGSSLEVTIDPEGWILREGGKLIAEGELAELKGLAAKKVEGQHVLTLERKARSNLRTNAEVDPRELAALNVHIQHFKRKHL